jgi:hypothetical protein
MASSKWFWAATGFVLVLAVTLVPGIGFPLLGPLTALIVGGAAAWVVLHQPDGASRQATMAGVAAGVGALVASVVAFAVLGYLLGSLPGVQEMVRASEPYPEARLPYDWIAPLGAALGVFAGLVAGAVNLVLAVAGAWLGSLLAGHREARRFRELIG